MSEIITVPTITPEASRGSEDIDAKVARWRKSLLETVDFSSEASSAVSSPEQEQGREKIASAAEFRFGLENLQEALLRNPHAHFTEEDKAAWVVDDGGIDEGSIYGKILSRLEDDAQPLLPSEQQIYRYMQAETQAQYAEAKLSADAVDNLHDKVKELRKDLEKELESVTDPEEIQKYKERFIPIDFVLDHMEKNQSEDDADKDTPLELYAQQKIGDQELQQEAAAFMHHTLVYDMLASKYPRIKDFENRQAEASQRLAEQTANRQKRVALLDPSNYGNKKAEYEALNAERMQANQELIAEEIRNMTFASQDEINLYIAKRTVDLCKDFDEQVRQQYMKNDKLVGKAINFLTGRNPDGTPDKSKGKAVARILVQAGVAAGIIAGTLATGGAGVAVAAGAATGLRVYAQGQKIVRNKRVKRTGGLLSEEEVLARIKETDELASDSEFTKSTDELRIMAAADMERKAIDKDTRKWRLGNLATVAAGVVAGTAAGVMAHGINSGESASALDATSGQEAAMPADAASPDVAPSILETNIGPSNVYVSPGDGFYNVFESMNIPEAQWGEILNKVGPELVQSGDAYWMADGTPGISSPGMLSQHAYEVIMNAKGF